MLVLPRTIKKWKISKRHISYKDVFLESIGKHRKLFKSDKKIKKLGKLSNWQSRTKGTVHNYKHYFDDRHLEKWSELMK